MAQINSFILILELFLYASQISAQLRDEPYCRSFPQHSLHKICENPELSKYCPVRCQNYTLHCYSCQSMTHPNQCTHIKRCQKDEVCAVFGSIDHNFHRTYNTDCVPKNLCNLFIHPGKRSTTAPAECCSTSKCNNKILDPSHNLTCYSCNETSDPDSCLNEEKCQAGELCVITQSFDHNFQWTYRLGCMGANECSLFKHDGLSHKRSVTAQGDCCDTDKCNHPVHTTPRPSHNCRDIDQAVCANITIMDQTRCTEDIFRNYFCPASCNVCHSRKCVDVNPSLCSTIANDPQYSCNTNIIRNYFCPLTCKTCYNCYNCQSKSPETCHKLESCNAETQKCLVHKVHSVFFDVYDMRCADKQICDHFSNTNDSSRCCDTEKCNLPSKLFLNATSSTTQVQSTASTAHTTTTVSTIDSTTQVPTTDSTTQVPTTDSTTQVPTTDSTTQVPTTDSTTQVPTTDSTTQVPTTDSTTQVPTTDSTTQAPTTPPSTTQSTTKGTTHFEWQVVPLETTTKGQYHWVTVPMSP